MNGQKMKVLMTTDTTNGIWNYSLELCRTLEKYNIQVHLVALGGWPSPYQQTEAEERPNVTFYKSDFKLDWLKETWEDLNPTRKWLNSIYHTVNPDIFHLNNFSHVEESWTTSLITAFHSGGQTWWHAAKGEEEPVLWNEYIQEITHSLDTLNRKEKPMPGDMKNFRNRRRNAPTRQAV